MIVNRSSLIAGLVLLSVFYVSAPAQFTAAMGPAETEFRGQKQGLVYVGIYDGVQSLAGGIRYGVGGYSDISVRLGLLDYQNTSNGIVLSGDYRYQLMELRIKDPLDLSLGGLVEYVSATGANIFSLGGFVIGSRNIHLTDSMDLWPYARLTLRWDSYQNDDKINIGFNPGASLDLSETATVTGEFQFDNDFGFVAGLAFGF